MPYLVLPTLVLALATALAPVASAQRPTHITVLGDAGAADPGAAGVAASWPACIAWHHVDMPIVSNLSRADLAVADALAAFRAGRPSSVDVVVAHFGCADAKAGTDPEAFGRDLRALVAGVGASVVLVSPCPSPASAPYADQVRSAAEDLGIAHVDAAAIFARRGAFPGHAVVDWCTEEGVPMAEGHRVLADLVGAALSRPDLFGEDAAFDYGPSYRPRPDVSIPIVDVSQDRERQVVVDREAGQYLGHPTTVLLDDGRTMFAVYPKGHGRGPIVMKRSDDGGRTWSERLPTPASWATSKETPTIHRVVDAEGTRRLVLFSGLHPIRMAVSEDDGATWSELEPIGEYGGIVAMSCVIPMATPGRYLALFHDDGRFFSAEGRPAGEGPRFRVYQVESVDGGLSWGEPRVVVDGGFLHHCEPGSIRSPDGKTVAVLLRENSRRRNSHVIFSDDEGTTWSEPREVPGSLTGDRHMARYTADGRLFVTFRDTALVSPTQGDWVAWVGTWQDLVEGREGQYRVRLMDNTVRADCAYPGLEVLPDGALVATTYGHWTAGEAPYIVSVRLEMGELDGLLERDPR